MKSVLEPHPLPFPAWGGKLGRVGDVTLVWKNRGGKNRRKQEESYSPRAMHTAAHARAVALTIDFHVPVVT